MNKICMSSHCEVPSTYGIEKNKPMFCSRHKLRSMKNVIKNVCESIGCQKDGYYKVDKLSYCQEHKPYNAIYMNREPNTYYKYPAIHNPKNEPMYYINYNLADIKSIQPKYIPRERGTPSSFRARAPRTPQSRRCRATRT